VHRLHLTGLRPATDYRYRVRSGRARSAVFPLRTPPAEPQPFAFAVYGGAGDDPERHARVAQAIRRADPAFIVYTRGHPPPFSTPPASLEEWRAQLFGPARELLASCPIVPVPETFPRPASLYDRFFPTPTGARWRSHRHGRAEVFALDPAQSLAPGSEQHGWLRNALRRSTACWKFVASDVPVVDRSGDAALRRALLPLLLDAGVSALFTRGGHCQRTVPLRLGPGADAPALVGFSWGNRSDAPPPPLPWTAAALTDARFLLVHVQADQVALSAHTEQGEEFDRTVLPKPGTQEPREKGLSAEALEAFLAFLSPTLFVLPWPPAEPVQKACSVPVVNPYRVPIQGELRWEVAPESGWAIEPPVLKIDVPPLETRTYPFTVRVPTGKGDPAPTFTLVTKDAELKARESPFRVP
jgi:hypothetical protein